MRSIHRAAASAAALALVVGAGLVGCASTTSGGGSGSSGAPQDVGNGTTKYNTGDIKQFCPSKPTKVAYAKGSSNTWTKIVLAEIKDEASKCKNITGVLFTDAGGDQQKAISDLNGLVAQGVGAIVVEPESGAVQIPSIRAANKAGIGTIPLVSDPGGKVPTDYPDYVLEDTNYIGQVQADWLNKTIKKGTVAFLGGIPGAPSSQAFYNGLKKGLAKYPDLKLINQNGPIDTNWDAGQKKRVVAGLLAQNGRIDAIVSDYSLTDTGVIDAYKAAGLKLPALAGNASGNANGCQWEQDKFPYLSLDGTTSLGRIALRKALAATEGKKDPEPSLVKIPTFIDTEAGKDPKCDTSLPADADLSSSLGTAKLKALLGS